MPIFSFWRAVPICRRIAQQLSFYRLSIMYLKIIFFIVRLSIFSQLNYKSLKDPPSIFLGNASTCPRYYKMKYYSTLPFCHHPNQRQQKYFLFSEYIYIYIQENTALLYFFGSFKYKHFLQCIPAPSSWNFIIYVGALCQNIIRYVT